MSHDSFAFAGMLAGMAPMAFACALGLWNDTLPNAGTLALVGLATAGMAALHWYRATRAMGRTPSTRQR